MTFASSIENDFTTVMDDLESITVALNRDASENVTVANAHRFPMGRQLRQYSNVNIETDQIPWMFSVNEFNPAINAAQIRNLDSIIDANGVSHNVVSAQLVVLQTVWLVVTNI